MQQVVGEADVSDVRELGDGVAGGLQQVLVSDEVVGVGARLGVPKPTVLCPWPSDARKRKLAQIRRLEARASPDEPVLYSDEVDIAPANDAVPADEAAPTDNEGPSS